jgi:hypothetical protein
MRLTFPDQKSAQARQDKIFSDIQGKLEPGTTSWAIPYQDTDKDGKSVDTLWHITVDDRCRTVLTNAEVIAAGFPVETLGDASN